MHHSFNENTHKTYFHNAIKKYDTTDFNIELLEDNLTRDDALVREQYWILFYNTFRGDGFGFGELNPFYGKHHTDKSKEIISKSAKNKVVAKNVKINQNNCLPAFIYNIQ